MSTNATNETKPQSKLPTSMRYERVQEILESQPAIRDKLGPKTHPIETRFGEKVFFSKETVEITEALHSEGKDAHKVPLNDVLRMAARTLMRLGSSGQNNGANPPASSLPPTSSPVHAPEAAKPKKAKPAARPVQAAEPPPPPPTPPVAPPTPPPAPKKKAVEVPPQAPPPPPPKKTKAPAAKPVKAVASAAPAETAAPSPKPDEPEMPESELPPEKQPLKLPPDFDPSKYPHYSVQSSIYSLLLSALNMSEHYEKFPNAEMRQKKLDDLVRDYQDTCDPLKFKS